MENILEEIKKMIFHDLQQVEHNILSLANSKALEGDMIKLVIDHIINAGGKRLRAILAIIVGYVCNVVSESVDLATAVELIHTATLLHDDVIDESTLRRGKTSANYIWGNKGSILVGDYLFTQAFEFMIKVRSMDALRELSHASSLIAKAEVFQLQMLGKFELKIEDYLEFISDKTASLFAAACSSVAIAAGSSVEIVNDWRDFGLNFGICFQIVDDLLDITGQSIDIGKDIMQDFASGKITLPIILLLKEMNNEEKNEFIDCFSDSDCVKMKKRVNSMLDVHDIQKKVMDYAKYYSDKGIGIINQFLLNSHLEQKQISALNLLPSLLSLALLRRF